MRLEPIAAAIERIRATRVRVHPVVIAQVDLPGNDFSALFDTVDRATPAVTAVLVRSTRRPSGSRCSRRALAARVPGSRLVHPLHALGQSGARGHHRRGARVGLHGLAGRPRHPGRTLPPRDWHDLSHQPGRRASTRVGGCSSSCASRTYEGHYRGRASSIAVADRAFDAMVERRLMTAEQAARTVVPIYCRTEEELRAPVRFRAARRCR